MGILRQHGFNVRYLKQIQQMLSLIGVFCGQPSQTLSVKLSSQGQGRGSGVRWMLATGC